MAKPALLPKAPAPKRVAPYECPGCKYLVELKPCQVCEARGYRERRRAEKAGIKGENHEP